MSLALPGHVPLPADHQLASHHRLTTGGKPRRLRRIALFNDTASSPHLGCLAVTDAHDRMLARSGIAILHRYFANYGRDLWVGSQEDSIAAVLASPLAGDLAEVDAVLINAEGTIHHDGGRHLLAIVGAAAQLGLPVFVVNAVLEDVQAELGVLRQATDVTVRDLRSSEYLAAHDIPHRLVLDSILEARFVDTPDQDFTGKVVITDHHFNRDHDVGKLLNDLREELGAEAVYYPFYDRARRGDWRHAVANLSRARLVVTARHHGVYVAGLAGVPFVALGSNTWKIEGTLAMFGALNVCGTEQELRREYQRALDNPALFREFQQFFLSHRPLTTLERLAGLPANRTLSLSIS